METQLVDMHGCPGKYSLLAREINWMETQISSESLLTSKILSLLAREINWMET